MQEHEKDRRHEQKSESNAESLAQTRTQSAFSLSPPAFNITASKSSSSNNVMQLYHGLDGEVGGGRYKDWVDIDGNTKKKKKKKKKR